jgi:hypothetical protein
MTEPTCSTMRYPDQAPEVNAVLDVARSIRTLGTVTGFDTSDLFSRLDEPAGDWILGLLEIILDHEEKQTRFVRRWKTWRMKREGAAGRKRRRAVTPRV